MERGLLWLPLLVIFIWLAWAGWKEYQKVTAYQTWAEQFSQAKYDIYAVLGQRGTDLTWGKPTPNGVTELGTLSLQQVKSVDLHVDQHLVDLEAPPTKGRKIHLVFQFIDSTPTVEVPFTEIPLAIRWTKHLQACLQRLSCETIE